MKSYLDICQKILDEGEWQHNRTGIRTKVIPNIHWEHDMSDGFPLLTTKKIAWKTMATELEGFINGITSKKWYTSRGCNIWNEWANPHEVQRIVDEQWSPDIEFDPNHLEDIQYLKNDYNEHKKAVQLQTDDLGPIYGYQWRKFNAVYDEDDNGCLEKYDQLDNIVKTLKSNPDDRRLVCSAWNPVQLSRMALPPCHLIWILTHINGKLNLHWTQRSVDVPLGLCFNIASYGLLLELLCKECNMQAGNLSGMLCNCHIYENQLDGIREQLTREPRELPELKITNWDGIFNWTHQDIELHSYNPCPKIKMEVAV